MQSRTGFPLLAGMFLFLAGSVEVSGSEARHLGGRLQLFLDDWLVQSAENVRRVLHRPERRETAIRVDRPWEDIYMYNPVVIKDGHRYRMWYRAKYLARPFLTAYAESLDGIHWVKPNLGLIEFDGSRDNNIIWPIAGADGRSFSVFKDENPDARSDARYKAITNLNEITESGKRRAVIYGLGSPDGLRWRHLHKEPMVKALVEDPQFDSHNIALWDSVRRHYAIYARGWYRKGLPPPGSDRAGRTAHTVTMKLPSGETREMTHIRDIRRYVSKDFANWSPQEYIGLGGAPMEHLYKNSATPYYRDPGLMLMFPKRFLPTRKADPDWEHIGLSDIVFMFSRDGLNFDRRYMEAFLRPGRDPLAWHERSIHVGTGLVPTGEREMSLYFIEHGKTARMSIRRGVLRVDGLASLRAPYSGGTVLTRPLTFSGSRLVLNYSTSAAGQIRVEVQDEAGAPLPGFGMEDCPEIYGDEIERVVAWRTGSDLTSLAGRTVRLRIEMKDADLFSLRFR